MQTRWKIQLGLVALLAVGAVAGGRLLAPSSVAVRTVRPERRTLTRIVAASGEIRAGDSTSVFAEHTGRITGVRVAEGEPVVRGQILAKLETDQPRAEAKSQQAGLRAIEAELRAADQTRRTQDASRAALEATLERTQAELERARLLHDRAVELNEDGLIARNELELRRAELRESEAALAEAEAGLVRLDAERAQLVGRREAAQERVDQAAAQLERLEDALRTYSVVSPIDGVVSRLAVEVGDMVAPALEGEAASPILTLADMATVTAEARVAAADADRLEPGQPAEIRADALPGRALEGRVAALGRPPIPPSTGSAAPAAVAAGQQARDFPVTITLDDPPRSLRPGMRCTIRIVTAARENLLAIPLEALTVRPDAAGEDHEGVFVVRRGRAEFISVETGVADGGWVEIVSGLAADDRIVTGGRRALQSLAPGTAVRGESK